MTIISAMLTAIIVYSKSKSIFKTLKWGLFALFVPQVIIVALGADRDDL